MIIPLVYYLTMVIWMPRNALERCQFLLGLLIFTLCGPFINISVTVYALVNMDNFGWGKTRKVIAETGEAEEPNADDQKARMEQVLRDSEKVAGSQVPDEENQMASRAATPYTAPSPRLRRVKATIGTHGSHRAQAENVVHATSHNFSQACGGLSAASPDRPMTPQVCHACGSHGNSVIRGDRSPQSPAHQHLDTNSSL